MALVPLFRPSPARLRVLPDEPGALAGPRPRGSRRPHPDVKVAAVRRLIEQTELTYSEIAARTGVGRASICRWTRDGGWQRPLLAPRATDTVPSWRASAKLKRRTLAARLAALAERHIRALEDSACVDPAKLGEALELLKMARLAALPRRRRRWADRAERRAMASAGELPEEAIKALRAAGVIIERAPPAALADFIASRAPPRDEPALRPRGRYSKRNRAHAWMLEPNP
jgi:hypothetical protein